MGHLAISVPVPGPLADSVEYARHAEALGYTEAWLAEVGGPDAFALAGALSVQTGLRLGTAVVPIYNRTPMVLAMTAASLSQLSGGRFVLGIGTSSENIVERWNGLPFEKPYTRMRETLDVVKRLLAGEKVTYEGETLRLDGYRMTVDAHGEAKVYIAALNRRMLRLAGEMADGVILNMLAPEHIPTVLAEVAEGARAAGRDPGEIESVARIHMAYGEDFETAAGIVRMVFGPYAATSVYNRFFRWIGFEEEADAIAKAWAAKDREGLAGALSDRMAEAMVVWGDRDRCRERLQAYFDAGLDVAALNPLVLDTPSATRMMEALAPSKA
ncbi:MAG TPA: LLM class F420-dependent oxidoreductase [Acidimicrobiia bacterium]|nr:LLM class F420-dependent oxidoreductase [Acidimicrobiia bacterium]